MADDLQEPDVRQRHRQFDVAPYARGATFCRVTSTPHFSRQTTQTPRYFMRLYLPRTGNARNSLNRAKDTRAEQAVPAFRLDNRP